MLTPHRGLTRSEAMGKFVPMRKPFHCPHCGTAMTAIHNVQALRLRALWMRCQRCKVSRLFPLDDQAPDVS